MEFYVENGALVQLLFSFLENSVCLIYLYSNPGIINSIKKLILYSN